MKLRIQVALSVVIPALLLLGFIAIGAAAFLPGV
jgi:hypothetical protein